MRVAEVQASTHFTSGRLSQIIKLLILRCAMLHFADALAHNTFFTRAQLN